MLSAHAAAIAVNGVVESRWASRPVRLALSTGGYFASWAADFPILAGAADSIFGCCLIGGACLYEGA